MAAIFRKYNIGTIHKPTRKLKSKICNMKDKVHPMDKVGAIYQTECKRHPESVYIGETQRALKKRGYDHRAVTHRDAERSHSIDDRKDEVGENEQQSQRRSMRNTRRRDYRSMHTGEDIVITEGNTEMSKHVASAEHEKGDIEIEAISYDENWYTRGIREAIEIKRRKPKLNLDGGRYHLSAIYDNIVSRDQANNGEEAPLALPIQEELS